MHVFHLPIPEFQFAAILLGPMLIEIDDHIHSAIQMQTIIYTEISMHAEVPTFACFVVPTSNKIGVRNQSLDG
ncbi:hypothetical protein LPB72_10760 [Hydrogenophaga crassostreae]|uniref:Uncharacterized protein n=1 Tax=Hydrogenophaga crassostreae TaxID=1763535 RepID=A0A167HVC9_9BURK|nr:hypothetical protein LPB072_12135 [Hydrogenophaga crassostreae]OAD41785.1 hypothetical protein LPB72_10760 [Hydrogenophaga crassostreae]